VFFTIAFGVPWAGWTAANVLANRQHPSSLLLLLFYTGDFCTVAGFVACFVDRGWPGIRDLCQRFIRWRVPGIWWIYAGLLPFAWLGVAVLVWGLTHGGIGRVHPLQVFALFAPLSFLRAFSTGPLGEESGWRGFLLPKLLEGYTPLTASLILGVLWGLWHLPLYIKVMLATPSLAARFMLSTVGYSVLITILFLHTRYSVLLAMVFHYAINAWPPVLALIFPDIHMKSQGPAGWVSTASMAAVALGFLCYLGPQLSRKVLSFGASQRKALEQVPPIGNAP
jgi:uncharacterized protein